MTSAEAACAFEEWPVPGGRAVLWRGTGASSLDVVLQPAMSAPGSLPDRVPTSLADACPPESSPGPSAVSATHPPAVVTVIAHDFAFVPREITVSSSGTSTIVFANEGAIMHNYTVDELRFRVAAARGESAEGALVDAPPGTYEAYCSIAGHRQAGMVGVLTVE
jgi:plastocyanin